jgi:hypothetical protein
MRLNTQFKITNQLRTNQTQYENDNFFALLIPKCPNKVAPARNYKVFYENLSIRGLYGFKSSFQKCF